MMSYSRILLAAALSMSLVASSQAQTNEDTVVTTNSTPSVASTNTPAAGTNDLEIPIPSELFTNSVDMELVKVGSFWVGKYEVTQEEYSKLADSNPSAFVSPRNPVDSVSYEDAVAYCQKLTKNDLDQRKIPAGYSYTLPTEAQWNTIVGDASLNDAVTSQSSPRSGSAMVGSLGPNSNGLYDTRGNVMEFCLADPSKTYRVLKGGSWQDTLEVNLRLEFRNYCLPDDSKNTYGFRCVLLPPPS
jgi:formylglycine-generating enzyme required for sulfatase activity